MIRQMLRNLKMYRKLDEMGWKEILIYRLQTAVWLVGSIFSTIAGFVIVTVIYGVSAGIPGWSYFQLLALTSIANIAGGFLAYYVSIYSMVGKMRNGGIDMMLTKPVNPVIYIIMLFASQQSAPTIASGTLMLAYSLYNLHIALLPLLAFIPAFGLGALAIVLFGLSFGLVLYVIFKEGRFGYWLLDSLQQATNYPLKIYGGLGVTVFTLFIPFGIAVFYPAELLLSKISYPYLFAVIGFELLLIAIFYTFSKWVIENKYVSGGG
jgi:ABC-2 type transport system permease protein